MKPVFLIALFALAACDPHVRIALPPAELAQCEPEPQAPDLPARDGTEATQLIRDRMTLGYILLLRTAYGSCAADVAGLAAWRKEAL